MLKNKLTDISKNKKRVFLGNSIFLNYKSVKQTMQNLLKNHFFLNF